MNTDPFVPKHGPRPGGQQLCRYSPTGRVDDDCGEPATWHVMWDGDCDNSVACDTHMQLVLRCWVFDDRHPVGADCTMPGALWLFKGRRCEVPSESTDVSASAAITTGVTA